MKLQLLKNSNQHKFYIFFLCIAIPSLGISVSLSQFLLLISIIFFFRSKNSSSFKMDKLHWIIFLLAFSFILSYFVNFIKSEFNWEYLKIGIQAELKDLIFFFMFFLMSKIQKEDEKYIFLALKILMLILIITGILSAFSPIRLAWLVMELFQNTKSWKFSHGYGEFFGIDMYLPIGLMNTHLTFGGIIAIVSPFIFFYFLISFKQKTILKSIIYGLFLLLLFFVFALNNARSAIIGFVISILFGLFHIIVIKKFFTKKLLIKVSIPPLAIILLFGLILAIYKPSRIFLEPLLGKEKHTDSGRIFIWSATFPLIKNNFFFGVGPGNYNKEIKITRLQLSEEHPKLYYFYETAQRGHAHNDYFHLFAIYGIFSLVLYLILFSMIIYLILDSQIPIKKVSFFYGLIGFFISGLLQCYFQDDEVVVVFWILLGFFANINTLSNKDSDLIISG